MTGMSDDEKPSEPTKRESWSAEDSRLLLITIAGGLAANIGTVLMVGASLAYIHWAQSGPHPASVHQEVEQILLVAAIAYVPLVTYFIFLFWARKNPERSWVAQPGPKAMRGGIAALALSSLMILLVLVGAAAGVK